MTRDTKTPPTGIAVGLSLEELAALPQVIDVITAGRALGISRSTVYRMIRQGEFPVETFVAGPRSRKVAKHKLLAHLGITPAA